MVAELTFSVSMLSSLKQFCCTEKNKFPFLKLSRFKNHLLSEFLVSDFLVAAFHLAEGAISNLFHLQRAM